MTQLNATGDEIERTISFLWKRKKKVKVALLAKQPSPSHLQMLVDLEEVRQGAKDEEENRHAVEKQGRQYAARVPDFPSLRRH